MLQLDRAGAGSVHSHEDQQGGDDDRCAALETARGAHPDDRAEEQAQIEATGMDQ